MLKEPKLKYLILFFSLVIFFLILFIGEKKIKEEQEVSFVAFLDKVKMREVKEINIESDSNILFVTKEGKIFRTSKDPNSSLWEIFEKEKIPKNDYLNIKINKKAEVSLVQLLLSFILNVLPVAIIIWFIWQMFKQTQRGTSQIFTFGKSGIKVYNPDDPNKVTFKDVANLEEAKQELMEIVEFLKNPDKFLKIGAKIPKGVLLVGPPGSGKTLLARATAAEAGVPFFYISGSEFVEMFVGVGASVSGDTPVLIKKNGKVKLLPIKKVVDRYYKENEEGVIKFVDGLETLGYESKGKYFFKRPKWTKVKGVFRHKVNKIYEIYFRGGKIKVTGDHSIFVREKNKIVCKRASELKVGDVLVNLPVDNNLLNEINKIASGKLADKTKISDCKIITTTKLNIYQLIEKSTIYLWLKSWESSQKPVITKILVKPYNDYVYDFCGCENEAFFGGEKPILLHNSRVRDAFTIAKRNQPCILFIDEIDAIGKVRGVGITGGHEEREQTLNQILVEMDGFEKGTKVIVLAATNRPDVLDPALLRPGRFDRKIVLDLPDVKAREEILKIHLRDKRVGKVNLKQIAELTPGFSGADLANLCNEAAILAARRNKEFIEQEDLLDSIEKVLLGPERKTKVYSKKEKEIAAYHEAGHAVVTHYLPHTSPVQKISIISRGRAGGYTLKTPLEERSFYFKREFLDELASILGGYAAEKLIFNDVTTGASNDLEIATDLARQLVLKFGMSEKLGPVSFSKPLKEFPLEKEYSEKTAEIIDEEVKTIINQALERALKVLNLKRDKLEKVAKILMKKEVIERKQFERIVKEKKVTLEI